jgi:hypothetical protein
MLLLTLALLEGVVVSLELGLPVAVALEVGLDVPVALELPLTVAVLLTGDPLLVGVSELVALMLLLGNEDGVAVSEEVCVGVALACSCLATPSARSEGKLDSMA